MGTLTLPANFWTVGKTVRISLSGYWSQTGSSPTRTVTANLGGTTMLNVSPSTFGGGVTNQGFKLESVMTCRATGASGTVYTQGRLFLGGNNTYGLATTAAVTVDTTAAKAIDVKWT